MVEQQPGQVISPRDQSSNEPVSVQNPPQTVPEATALPQQPPSVQIQQQTPAAPAPSLTPQQNITPTPQPAQIQPTPAAPLQQPAPRADEAPQQPSPDEPASSFTTSGFDQSEMAPVSDNYSPNEPSNMAPISWTASEYIAHNKNAAWFLALAVLVVLVTAGVYFLTKDILSAIVIILVGVVFGMYAGRKPREQTYAVNEAGVVIGNKLYDYGRLRSFTVHQEDAFPSITFMPFGRFMPPLSMYYAPQDEEQIIAALSVYLPYETYKRDPVDTLMRKIRF